MFAALEAQIAAARSGGESAKTIEIAIEGAITVLLNRTPGLSDRVKDAIGARFRELALATHQAPAGRQ